MTASANAIDVLVAEDNQDLCTAVCELIDAESDMRVAGTVARVAELLDAVMSAAPRVLVLDLDLGGESSMPVLHSLRTLSPKLAVVVYSGHDPHSLAHVFSQIGQCEYVTKTGDATELLDAIRRGVQKTTGAGN
jgi:DNA-binding NarL/FixJ family response regulator